MFTSFKKKLNQLEQRVEELEKATLTKYKCQIASKNKEIKMLKARLELYEPITYTKSKKTISEEDVGLFPITND